MRTTIIIPFRHLASVPLCLASLEMCGGIEQHQVILVQQGSKRFDLLRPNLNLKYLHIADDGPFNLAKLQNAAMKIARTEWVTILDPCLVVPADFLVFIENLTFANKHSMIYFPIRHLDSHISQLIALRFNLFYEKVTPSAANWRLRCETYKGYPIGTDCFAIPKSDYIDIGGYDECYADSELAHIDFACRWLNECGRPHRAKCDVFHRWRRLDFWADRALNETEGRKHFAEREQAGFPPLDKELR